MRILVLNPNTSAELTHNIHQAARRAARRDVEIVTVASGWGPETVEGHFDESIATTAMLQTLQERGDGFDGVVVACFGDPGLFAAREISTVPVVGIAEAAMHFACAIADRFSIVTVLERMRPQLRHLLAFHGLSTRCASIRATGLSVLECARGPEAAGEAVAREAREAVEVDGAEAILLGCSGMSALEVAVRDLVDVPVLDGIACAVKFVEGLVDCGLTTSKRAAFMAPGSARSSVSELLVGA